MVLCSIGGAITALFMGPAWDAFIWAFAAAITAFDLVLVDTLRLQEKREFKQDVQHKNVYIAELEAKVDDLGKQCRDYAANHESAMGQLQALDNEYLKLAKQHNDMAQDLDNANQKVEELTRAMEAKAIQKTPRKRQKRDYTEQDQARIREEMKAGGLIKDED